jgi:hypothetical protein
MPNITNTHSWSITSSNGASPIQGQQTETGTSLLDLSPDFPAGTSQPIAGCAIAYATLKSLFMKCTKDATIVFTLTTGTKTINLSANEPYVFNVSDPNGTNPFGFNVVSAAITNTVGCSLYLRALN